MIKDKILLLLNSSFPYGKYKYWRVKKILEEPDYEGLRYMGWVYDNCNDINLSKEVLLEMIKLQNKLREEPE